MSTPERPPINLIYIASIGRSGSTLLESILGAHSQIETVGELHLWPHEINAGGITPCGSGLMVTECPFWREMRVRVDPIAQPEPQIHHFREKHNGGRTLRPRRLAEFGERDASVEVRDRIDQYGRNNYDVFRHFVDIVEEQTGRRPSWVVDASKDPYRLNWLVRSGYFNIRVFHLVKDPRGFAYSVTKNWIHGDQWFRGARRLYYTARQSLAWVVQNRLLTAAARSLLDESSYVLVQYEQLAAEPEETIRRVLEVVNCPYEQEAIDHFRQGSPFTIAGNPMRYQKGGIFLDEKWKTKLPWSSRKTAELVSGVSRSKYGYH